MSQAEFEDVIYTEHDGVATITVNRPDKMNAYRTRTYGEVTEAIVLEAMWNGLIAKLDFDLMCAYPTSLMETSRLLEVHAVCDHHTSVHAQLAPRFHVLQLPCKLPHVSHPHTSLALHLLLTSPATPNPTLLPRL